MKEAIWLFGGRIFLAKGIAGAKAWPIQGATRKLVRLEHSECGGLIEEEDREVPGGPNTV